MAKGKKNAGLSAEERLEAALVPNWEQPYQLPENWCWVRHNSILDISGGSQPDKSHFISEHKEGYTQLYQTRDYGERPIPVYIPDHFATKTTTEGDILLARYGGSLGKVFRAHDGAYNVALAKVINLYPDIVDIEYLYNYYLSHFYQDFCIKAGKGRSAQAGFNRDDLGDLLFPLAPLTEQQRIVDRIESLFAKLDEAKEKAQAVVDGFEERKAAILHKAFTGKLTEAWRQETKVNESSWHSVPWGSFLLEIEAGKNWKAESRPPVNDEFGVVKVSAVTWGEFNENESKTCTSQEQWNERVRIHSGDFLFSRANTIQLVGNCVIVDKISKRLMLSDKILRFSFDETVCDKYVLYFTRSLLYREQVEAMASGNQDGMRNISQINIRKIVFPIPCFQEQERIVSILDSLFEAETKAKDTAELIVERIDEMKKAILSKAFRGELGTNDPNDESAIELLKKVLQEENPEPKQIRRIMIPKDLAADLKTELEKKIVKLYLQRETSVLPVSEIMGVSSKKFDVLESIRSLEQRQIISKQEDGNYKLMR